MSQHLYKKETHLITAEHVEFCIDEYYLERGLKMPTSPEARDWALTELGEAIEVWMRKKDWVRNNKDKETLEYNPDEYGTELGDVLMMVMVAGMVEGVNPLHLMLEKMRRKTGQ